MKYLLLLLAVLLTLQATEGIGCELVCNGLCTGITKLCELSMPKSPTCLTTQTSCSGKCAKICLCVSQCDMQCSKPEGACKATDATSQKPPCTTQQSVCKKLTCPLKCVASVVDDIVPDLPDLSKLSSGVGNVLQGAPGDLLGKANALVPSSLPKLVPLPNVPSLPSLPNLLPPLTGFPNLPGSMTKPATDVFKSPLTPTNIGAPITSPVGKPSLVAPAASPDSEEEKPSKPNPASISLPTPKEAPKPVNPFSNPASPNNLFPAPAPLAKPANLEPAKRSSYKFG